MDLIWGIVIAVLILVLVYFLYAQYHYNVVVRRRLANAQQTCYSGSDVHVATALVPRDGADLSDSVASLAQQVKSAGGKVIYVGRVLSPAAESTSISKEEALRFRVVLVTQWSSLDGFKAFRASALRSPGGPWELAWSTPWKRSPAVNVGLPVMLYGLKLKSCLSCCKRHDVATEGTKADFDKSVAGSEKAEAHMSFDKIHMIATALEQEPLSSPVLIWNWLKDHESAEVRAATARYGMMMMEMLSQSGGGIMEMGTAVQGSDGEAWSHFEQVAAVHYPDVNFFTKLIKSRWMMSTLQDKELGDTMALITVPWAFGDAGARPLRASA